MQEISPSPVPMERQSEIDQDSNSKVKKATKIQKFKEHLKEHRILDRHLKQENSRLK